jgi:hypothetical protein
MFTSQQLPSIIEMIRSQGRNGDTMLAHINPQEAQMLQSMGGSGTINPNTGLPEFFFGGLGGIIPSLFSSGNLGSMFGILPNMATQAMKSQIRPMRGGIAGLIMSNPEILKEAMGIREQKQNTSQKTQPTPKTQPQNPDFMKEVVQKLKENNISPFKRKLEESNDGGGIFDNLFGVIPSTVAKNTLSNPITTGIVPKEIGNSLLPSMGGGLGYAISGRWGE